MASSSSDKSVPDVSEAEDKSLSMKIVTKTLSTKWPSVKSLSTNTFQRILSENQESSSENRTTVVHVFDVRPEEEYVISHLEAAKRIEPTSEGTREAWEDIKRSLQDAASAATVVCYCSLGYRSAKCAESLTKIIEKEAPDKLRNINIYNLEGSLFKWANEGKAMVDSRNEPTVFAHPYNALWGKLLKKQLRKWKIEDGRPA